MLSLAAWKGTSEDEIIDHCRAGVTKEENEVTLYTGNDHHIVLDLLALFDFMRDDAFVQVSLNRWMAKK